MRLHDDWLAVAKAADLKYTREAPIALELWDDRLPDGYHWLYDDAESLGRRLRGLDDERQLQQLLVSMSRDRLAYAHMATWKVHELASWERVAAQ